MSSWQPPPELPPRERLRVALAGRVLPQAPSEFRGNVAELVDRLALPLCPAPEVVARFHERLMQHLQEADPVCVVRAVSGLERGTEARTRGGQRLLPGDNGPPWWLHALLVHDVLPEGPLEPWLAALPTHRDQTHGVPHLNQARWHLAHLAPVNNGDTDWASWSAEDVQARVLRNLHPVNQLPLPLVDWQHTGAHEDVLAYAAWRFRGRYRRTWFAFQERCGATLPSPSEVAGRTALVLPLPGGAPGPRRRGRSPSEAPSAPARTLEALHLICRDDAHLTDLGDGRFETGFWAIKAEHGDDLQFLALHERKAALSYRQGRVLGWRRADWEGGERLVFTVQQQGPPVMWRGGGWAYGYVWSDGRNGDGSK